jgi:O-antigen ligase
MGLLAVILYCVLFGRKRIRNVTLALVGGLVFYLSIPDSYKGEIESIQQTSEGTAEARFFLWTSAWNMWKDNPVLGVGAGNSIWNVGRYQPEGTDSGMFSGRQYHERDFTMTAIHSAFFQVLSEMGTAGSLVFIALVVGHFTGLLALRRRVEQEPRIPLKLRRESELYTVALGGAMAGYLAAGAFLSVGYYPYPWYFSAFAVAWARAVDGELRSLQQKRSLRKASLTRAPKFT